VCMSQFLSDFDEIWRKRLEPFRWVKIH